MTTESITVSFLGVDERSKSAYQFFFKSVNQGQVELIDDYTKAQLCLIDKDSYNIQDQYDEFVKNFPDKYILILSLHDQTCHSDKEIFVRKPVKRDTLQNSLNQICGLITGKAVTKPFQAFPFKTPEAIKPKKKAVEAQAAKEKINVTDNATVKKTSKT